MHDAGYVQKALGSVAEPVAHTFPDFVFEPTVNLDRELEGLPVARLYRLAVKETEHGQHHASLPRFLERHYREVHSLVGALWLALLPRRMAEELHWRDHDPAAPPPGEGREGWTDLVLQLGAMMALCHDLALSDKPRRELLGLREREKGRDILNLEDFPLCTIFSLCDVLQEFGRPVRVIDRQDEDEDEDKDKAGRVAFVVPMVGLRLEHREAPGRADQSGDEVRHQGVDAALLGLPELTPPRGPRLEVRFVTRDSGHLLLTPQAERLRSAGAWDERRVGDKVPAWLARAGLDRHVALGGAPGALEQLGKRYDALSRAFEGRRPHHEPLRGTEQRTARRLMAAALRSMGLPATNPETRKDEVREAVQGDKHGRPGRALLKVAPLADLAEAGLAPLPALGNRALVPEPRADGAVAGTGAAAKKA